MPVPDFETYCAILDRARAEHFALLAINVTSLTTANAVLRGLETAMAERVKRAASDLRASGKTTFAS